MPKKHNKILEQWVIDKDLNLLTEILKKSLEIALPKINAGVYKKFSCYNMIKVK